MNAVLLLLARIADRWIGEWPARLHPVVWMGTLARAILKLAPTGNAKQFCFGLGLACLPALWGAAAWGVTQVQLLHGVVGLWLVGGCFAGRMLGDAGLVVARAVEAGDLPAARRGLGSLCSRDPSALSETQLLASAIESVAENTSDSLVAPLFWYAVAGLPGLVAYRMANTLDSMVGYRGKYEWLGKASARLDDGLNLIPARITAALLVLAAALLGEPAGRGARVGWRDAGRTASPNAGWPMATMAGLLGVCLDKPEVYQLYPEGGPATAADYRRCWRICRLAMDLWSFAVLVGVALAHPGFGG